MRWLFLIVQFCLLYVGNANAVIIDLNSRVNDLNNPVNLNLDAGTYNIDPIGTADGGLYNAWNAWGITTCTDPAGCPRTSPTTVVGWLNVYSFGSADLTNVFINGVAATPSSGDIYYVDPFLAYPDPLSALADAWSAQFTLNTASVVTVSFAIPDRPLSDNVGGMSLRVDATSAPEPPTIALMGLGLVGIGIGYKRQRSKKAG